jgi:PIN domain nuclease of toxin-antitoxin system
MADDSEHDDLISALEIRVARAVADHTKFSWDLTLAKAAKAKKAAATAAAIEKAAMKRRCTLVELPDDPVARAIIAAGMKRRNETT